MFDDDNPFDLLGIDPRLDPQELTALLRKRAERALPEERAHLQGLWRKLTLKESDRVKWAFMAHPKTNKEGAKQLDELKDKVPPYLSRFKPAPLVATAHDALVSPPPTDQQSAPILPPSRFDRMDE